MEFFLIHLISDTSWSLIKCYLSTWISLLQKLCFSMKFSHLLRYDFGVLFYNIAQWSQCLWAEFPPLTPFRLNNTIEAHMLLYHLIEDIYYLQYVRLVKPHWSVSLSLHTHAHASHLGVAGKILNVNSPLKMGLILPVPGLSGITDIKTHK